MKIRGGQALFMSVAVLCVSATAQTSLVVGAKELVYSAAQRTAAGLPYWPDGNIGVVPLGGGSNHFYAANSTAAKWSAGSLLAPASAGVATCTISGGAAYNYKAGGPLYRDPVTGRLLLVYHAEIHQGGDFTKFYSVLGLAINEAGSTTAFRDCGAIVQANLGPTQADAEGRVVEVCGGPFITRDGKFCVYFRDTLTNGAAIQLAAAEAPIADVMAAATNFNAVGWLKYYSGSFSQPGIGGLSSPLEAGNPGVRWMDVKWCEPLNQYVMVLSVGYPNPDLHLMVSSDGLNWSSRSQLESEAGESFYPSLIGLGDDPQVLGGSFYVYYTYSVAGDFDRWSDAELVRRLITLDGNPPPAPPALVAHVELEDGSGVVAADTSGHGHHASVVGGAVWTNGYPSGGAVRFDPAGGDDYLQFPASATLNNLQAGAYSLSAWFKPLSTPAGVGSANNAAYGIVMKKGYHSGLKFTGGARFAFDHWLTANTYSGVSSAGTYATGVFHHVAGVVDREAGTLALYVNGALAGSGSFTPGLASWDYGNTPWRVGIADPGAAQYRWPAHGVIDDVRLFNRALTSGEVAVVYGEVTTPATTTSSTTTSTSTSTSTTSTTAPSSGLSIPRDSLALWLDATDVVGTGTNVVGGSAVAVWVDKSGNGWHATQAVATNRPTLLGAALGDNALVRFDGGDWMQIGTLRATPGALQAFVVSRRTATQLASDSGTTYQRLLSTSDGGDGFDWQAPDWTLVGRYDGSGLPLVYGPDIRQLAMTNGTLKIANLTLGRDAANQLSRLRGDVAEVLVYTNALGESDVAAVTNYLHAKWLVATNTPVGDRPGVGAIRWDAWIGDAYGVGRAVHKSLGPAHWHSRLPYFGYAVSSTQVVAQSITQVEEDRQNAFAHAAGLDYWAFVMYSTNDPMTRFGIDLYQSSPWREAIQFCMINQGQTPASWPAFQSRMLSYFAMTNHVRVAGGRPLFYLFNPASMVQAGYFSSWADAKAAFDALRAASIGAGLGNPYLVAMDFTATTANTYRQNLGFDAISAYAIQGGHSHATYATLDSHVQAWWNSARNTGSAVIPTAMVGWDRRPRVENPVPWETWQQPGVGMDLYYAQPTPAQWAGHLGAALEWVVANPSATPAQSVLIYAWNEIDEGGWLLPTHVEQAARLAATREALNTPLDRDGDGMDDLWEVWNLHSPTNSAGGNADQDGDGFVDAHEYRARTDPTNAHSRLRVIESRFLSPDAVELHWQSASGVVYRVLEEPALPGGERLTNRTGIVATPPANALTVLTQRTTAFFRIGLAGE